MNKPRSKATSSRRKLEREDEDMKHMQMAAAAAALLALSGIAGHAAEGIDDPRRVDYFKTFEGKTIAFVPVTMGIDLTEGWASVMKNRPTGWA
jgi:hypothetical protein